MGKWILLVVLGLVLGAGACGSSSYNELVRLDEAVQAQWGQVENVYQRRADLVPNLVETVRASAQAERDTLKAVMDARARATQVTLQADSAVLQDPQAFERFQQAQGELSSTLSRLLVTVEKYPELKSQQGFRDLQAQLEGTENRISVERMRFNEAARAFNTRRNSFPTAFYVNFFGDRFKERPYFKAQAGAEQAPKVKFE